MNYPADSAKIEQLICWHVRGILYNGSLEYRDAIQEDLEHRNKPYSKRTARRGGKVAAEARSRLQATRARGVEAQHVSLSRRRSPVRIRSSPPRKADDPCGCRLFLMSASECSNRRSSAGSTSPREHCDRSGSQG